MITPQTAAIAMGILIIFMMVLVPMLDASKHFGKYISLRYMVTTVFLITAVGCVLDFSHLSDSTRDLVILGAVVLAGLFILVRSFEKIRLKGADIQIKGQYKEAKAEVNVKSQPEQENNNDGADNS